MIRIVSSFISNELSALFPEGIAAQLAFAFASGGLALFFAGLACAVLLAVLLFKRRWWLDMARRRWRSRQQRLRARGQARRHALVLARQRRNLKELATLTREQLHRRRDDLSLGLYHEAQECIRHAVRTLQFDRLHALHALLCNAEANPSRSLQDFLQQETYSWLPKT